MEPKRSQRFFAAGVPLYGPYFPGAQQQIGSAPEGPASCSSPSEVVYLLQHSIPVFPGGGVSKKESTVRQENK